MKGMKAMTMRTTGKAVKGILKVWREREKGMGARVEHGEYVTNLNGRNE